ncbi:MAG TPA: lamin tail domain-containing protein [Candidatus Saccharimonadia bacterium]
MASPSRASANLIPHLVISEVQTGTTTSASQEFIELYNPLPEPVSLTGWTIEYKAATSVNAETSWSKKATLLGMVPAQGFYLVAPKAYLVLADAEWTATLASGGGTIRLKDAAGVVVDQLGYGETANAAEGLPAPAPAAASIERLPGRTQPLEGNGVDTNDNAADFILRTEAQPQAATSLPEVPGEIQFEEAEEPDEPTELAVTAPMYSALIITELLVDPLAPLSDSHDEFIELYNPNAEPVDMEGYMLRCGSSFRDYYKLSKMIIPPGGYAVLYSRETGLSLTNSGGAVQLLDPNGTLVDQTPVYSAASAGQSWAAFEDKWEWTLQLTPGLSNVLALLPATTGTTALAKAKTAPKKAAVKPAAKPKKAAVSKLAKEKKPKKIKPTPAAFTPLPVAASRNLQPGTWLIISLAVLTIGYALYEFRYDIFNLYYRLRGKHSSRSDNRHPVKGRGRD